MRALDIFTKRDVHNNNDTFAFVLRETNTRFEFLLTTSVLIKYARYYRGHFLNFKSIEF